MRLYLMQHADALPKEVDANRPLSQRGRGDVERMAAFLGQRAVAVERIYHSGKSRARQTAEILGGRIAPGLTPERLAGINPDDPAQPIANDVGAWREDTLLVCHQPFLGKLTCLLVGGEENAEYLSFEPGTIVCLESMPKRRWTVFWMIRPKLLAGT
jgi:phosphohistidine phosphatase